MGTSRRRAAPRSRRYADGIRACAGSRRARCCWSRSARTRAAEIFKHLNQTEVEALSLEIAKAPKVPVRASSRTSSTRRSRPCSPRSYLAEGGVDYARSLLQKSLGAERAEEIISPPRGHDRARGRSSSCAARRRSRSTSFLRNESPQTIALVVANLHTTLAAQVLVAARRPRSRPTSPCASRTMGETRPEVVSQIESVHAAEALERDRPGVLVRRRRQVARRHPQPRRPLDRAQRARPARADQRRAGRGGPAAAVHLRGHRQARRPRRSSWCSRRSTRRTSRSRCAASSEDVRAPDLREHVRARRRDAPRGDRASSRRSAGASSRRRRAASSASCAASRRPARSSSRAAPAAATTS